MFPCGGDDWSYFGEFNQDDASVIDQHKAAEQFFCP